MPNKSCTAAQTEWKYHSGTARIKLMARRAACTASKEAAATAASLATKLRNKTNEQTNDNVKLHERACNAHSKK
jgi:hypothetical protein